MVAAVVFDYRGVDTMGEEFILFAAVMGVALLLRESRDEEEAAAVDAASSDALGLVGSGMVAPILLLGLWLAAFGYVTPGGGFQGGVVLAAALVLVYVAGSYRSLRELAPTPVIDAAEGAGAGGYVVVGLVGLITATAFLQNLTGKGKTGTLLSGGSIPLLNWASAFEVTAALCLLAVEFLQELERPRP